MSARRKVQFSPEQIEQLRAEFHRLLHGDTQAVLHRMRDPASRKVTLNADDLFHVLPRYAANPGERLHLGPLLYPIARDFTDAIYAQLLLRPVGQDDTVVFTAGGSATGKSTVLRAAGRKRGVDFLVDTTFSNTGRALDQIDRALAAGRRVEIHYVYRDFRESVIGMVERALDPRCGRIVPIDDMARTHFGSQRAVLEAIVKYAEDPRVFIELRANTRGHLWHLSEAGFDRILHPSVDALRELGQTTLNELRESQSPERRPDDQDHHSGGQGVRISEAFFEAARSQAQGRGAAPRQGHA